MNDEPALGRSFMQGVFVFTAGVMDVKVYLFEYDNPAVFVSACVYL